MADAAEGKKTTTAAREDLEQSEGLLSGEVTSASRGSHPRRLRCGLPFVVGSLVLLAFVLRPFTYSPRTIKAPEYPYDNIDFSATGGMRSNGTHAFKKTVIMVSIDGLRADYLDRGLTPHLFDISQVGLRARYMQPIFPSITFPNHWTILTGLYAESHGIVGNNFWDPEVEAEFVYNHPESALNSSWWKGEPIWETLETSNVKTANLMWLGPGETSSGVRPTYWEPWRNHVPLQDKLDQVMGWLDLPLESRPQLILAYEPSLDQAGHSTGPGSALVNATLVDVDEFAKGLHRALAERNLSRIVDIIFVSDHGMADTSHPEWVYLEDFIGESGINDIEHEDGWPSMGLRFSKEGNSGKYLKQLHAAAASNAGKFDVYTPETMPERYHFSNNNRIAPIYVVPRLGYALARRRGAGNIFTKGNHGYDNELAAMRAIFVADGPFTDHFKRKRSQGTSVEGFMIDGFPNVEVKSLIGRLLGVAVDENSHNGTSDFWNRYLD